MTSWDKYEKLISGWPMMTMVTGKKAKNLQMNEDALRDKIKKVCKTHC